MNIKSILAALILLISFSSCKKSGSTPDQKQPNPTVESNSFLPLQVGNYWRQNDENYTEVKDSVIIEGELYYRIYSLTGGDASSEDYLRIDKNQQLISTSLKYPDYKVIKAKFNANVGDTFQTIGDQSVNDYKATVIAKSDTKMTFSYDMIYHPNLIGHPYTVTFVKGIGWENWKTVKIGSRVFNQ